MRLLDVKSSPFSSRCRMVIYAKNRGDADEVDIIEPPGGLGSDSYKAFHPFVKIPTLDLGDGEMLLESDVICEYLDDVLTGPSLKPTGVRQLAHMRLITRIADLYVMAPMMPLFKQLDPSHRDNRIVERELSTMMLGFDKLEFYLKDGPYASGECLTLSDCTLVPTLTLTLEFLPRFDQASPLSDCPRLRKYWDYITHDPIAGRVIMEIKDKLSEYRAKKNE